MTRGGGLRWLAAAAAAIARRPGLWLVALRVLLGLVPSGWWRRWPPVPAPSRAWLSFRMETAYGRPDARPEAADVRAFLEWCKEMRRLVRA